MFGVEMNPTIFQIAAVLVIACLGLPLGLCHGDATNSTVEQDMARAYALVLEMINRTPTADGQCGDRANETLTPGANLTNDTLASGDVVEGFDIEKMPYPGKNRELQDLNIKLNSEATSANIRGSILF
jgi:hypothetical protein